MSGEPKKRRKKEGSKEARRCFGGSSAVGNTVDLHH